MKISFDPKYDVLYLKFSKDKIADTVEVDGGVLIDYGDLGQVIGIEIISMPCNQAADVVWNWLNISYH